LPLICDVNCEPSLTDDTPFLKNIWVYSAICWVNREDGKLSWDALWANGMRQMKIQLCYILIILFIYKISQGFESYTLKLGT